MGISPAKVYTAVETCPVENFKAWMKKNDMAINMATIFFLGEFSGGQVSWATSNPHTRNSAPENSNLRHFLNDFYSILSTIPTVASNNLVLGLNS